ncbi:MAG: alpha/beta fold hydrolase [Paraglaciecola chathamensis]
MCKKLAKKVTATIVKGMILCAVLHLMGCANSKTDVLIYEPDDELVVLAHGLGRSGWAMWRLAQRLEDAQYKVCRLDYATFGVSVAEALAETRKQIDDCTAQAPKVHFVRHSLGGLVIRAYLQNNQQNLKKARMGQVVLIGTPNKGSELADYLSDSWLMNAAGGITRALVTGDNSLGNKLDALDVNSGLKLGVIAGTKPLALTSARFNGPNDGLVSVASARLSNMSDFIAIEVSHSQLRYNAEVAEQTVRFLQTAHFKHE